ncbi:monogalactosyldiacylglycerol synthase [Oscillochloris trichoides DG-6]|uniref:Monogalactosyldiacylglycerol synthase n=1 Tax=Oscillochloris trichoides DG-6 TaxID=765420 RepID=E1ID72_9CHLR|nr:glycosyltransferase [Oscillochloris trichoides]EFO80851.1 monogalactosyldiacylglycerol synthase [Oscillochloris trichoides DG-6]
MPKRILILSASVGSGHKSAAAAIEQVCRSQPGVEVRNQDALKLTSTIFQVTASDVYFALVKENPWLVGWWYDQNDEPFRNEVGALQLWNALNSQPLAKFVLDYNPDITVCTHFMPAGVVAQLISQGKLNTSLSIVTTDYDFQGMWLSRVFNRYFVAIPETKVHLNELGVDATRITVSGIPVNPILGQPIDREAVLRKFDLRSNRPILLVSAGALGGGPVRDIVGQILRMETPVQTVVVCGHNKLLRDQIAAQISGAKEHFRVLGFTHEMSDLMRVAALFIGKPGGLSASECMAAGLPMVIVDPIPGQEERNSDHLLEAGAAVRCRSLMTMAYKIDQIFAQPGRIERMRENALALGRPDAAHTVVAQLLEETQDSHQFSEADLRRIIAAASGDAELPSPDTPSSDARVSLYHNDTGVYIGAISPNQLQFLIDQLEEESDEDETYFIDRATLNWLADQGADRNLLRLLTQAIAERGQSEIRWVKA